MAGSSPAMTMKRDNWLENKGNMRETPIAHAVTA
jgi:hypothetical protein